MPKFNDPAGTSDQQQCENTCGITDPSTGITTREDPDGNPFDVIWEGNSEAGYRRVTGLGKCFTCPYFGDYLATNP